jgi:hypothetical protein
LERNEGVWKAFENLGAENYKEASIKLAVIFANIDGGWNFLVKERLED